MDIICFIVTGVWQNYLADGNANRSAIWPRAAITAVGKIATHFELDLLIMNQGNFLTLRGNGSIFQTVMTATVYISWNC